MTSLQNLLSSLKLIHHGKVRDSYELPGHPDHMLVVASDRISIFDFVLNANVAHKGAILTAMNIFWRKLLGEKFPNDLCAFGRGIDQFLPKDLCGRFEIQANAVVVTKLNMIPVEGIVRGYLTGSGWDSYKKTSPHTVCGHILPIGLHDGSQLPGPIFTPTTKAIIGHDEHITFQDVRLKYGNTFENACLGLYNAAAQYALGRGIIIADTKFEGNVQGHLADEWLTPDSSRFWTVDDYKRSQAEKRSPVSYDKQFVRNWGKNIGINTKDPRIEADVMFVNSIEVGLDILNITTQIYHKIFKDLTGKTLTDFQRDDMGIG